MTGEDWTYSILILSCHFSGLIFFFCIIEPVFSNPLPDCGRTVLFASITFIILFAFYLLSHLKCLSIDSWGQEFSAALCDGRKTGSQFLVVLLLTTVIKGTSNPYFFLILMVLIIIITTEFF